MHPSLIAALLVDLGHQHRIVEHKYGVIVLPLTLAGYRRQEAVTANHQVQPSILTGVFGHQFPRCRVIRTVKRIAIYARLSVGDVAIGHISIQNKRQFVVIHALMAASLGCPPIVGVVLDKPGIDINQSVIAGLV